MQCVDEGTTIGPRNGEVHSVKRSRCKTATTGRSGGAIRSADGDLLTIKLSDRTRLTPGINGAVEQKREPREATTPMKASQ